MDKKIKEWGLIGFIIYCLTLPIMIWKSSKIGKVIFSILSIVVFVYAFNKVSIVAFHVYEQYIRISQLSKVNKQLEPVIKDIDFLKNQSNIARLRIEDVNNEYSKSIQKGVDEIKAELKDKLKFADIDIKMQEIEKGIDLIREEERQALKDKIITLKEMVKIEKKTIDSKDVRMACEMIAERTYLLNRDENSRFLQDLKDIGFGIEKIDEQTERIMAYDVFGNMPYSCVTANTVTMGYFPRRTNNIYYTNAKCISGNSVFIGEE